MIKFQVYDNLLLWAQSWSVRRTGIKCFKDGYSLSTSSSKTFSSIRNNSLQGRISHQLDTLKLFRCMRTYLHTLREFPATTIFLRLFDSLLLLLQLHIVINRRLERNSWMLRSIFTCDRPFSSCRRWSSTWKRISTISWASWRWILICCKGTSTV